MDNQSTYVCLGSCHAVITEDQYKNGLTACGDASCTLHGHPFVKGRKSERTGKNEPDEEEQRIKA
ncbi:MAG: hypothetical protein AAB553_06665 [Patescibacteria group bacterium]